MKDSEYREGHDPGYVKHAFKTLKKKKKKKKNKLQYYHRIKGQNLGHIYLMK